MATLRCVLLSAGKIMSGQSPSQTNDPFNSEQPKRKGNRTNFNRLRPAGPPFPPGMCKTGAGVS